MIALFAALLVAQAANAPQAPAQTAPSRPEPFRPVSGNFNTSTVEQRNQVICRRERVTGTNRVERVCATVAQRDDAREAAVRARDTNVPADPELVPQ